ncbi:hypothetical protein [Nonomuraea sp. GTA35]|uniref:hypothetical protein n=1 Tax=Nonomuraea sp. GTA35 TaxID=1676746 RepID=UPI0035BF8E8F
MSGAGRRFAGRTELAALVREVFGGDRRLAHVERLTGGSKKGVYRLSFQDAGPTAMLYAWSGDEDYWDSARVESREPFAHGSGLALFEAAHARLSSVGVRVPDLYFADGARELYPADVAVIEDVRGGTLEARLGGEDPRPLARLAESLRAMAGCRSRELGKVALVESGQGIGRPARPAPVAGRGAAAPAGRGLPGPRLHARHRQAAHRGDARLSPQIAPYRTAPS